MLFRSLNGENSSEPKSETFDAPQENISEPPAENVETKADDFSDIDLPDFDMPSDNSDSLPDFNEEVSVPNFDQPKNEEQSKMIPLQPQLTVSFFLQKWMFRKMNLLKLLTQAI